MGQREMAAAGGGSWESGIGEESERGDEGMRGGERWRWPSQTQVAA
jgi:hypothetical protein